MQQDLSERRLRDINRRFIPIFTDKDSLAGETQRHRGRRELGFLHMGSGPDILTILRKVSGSVNSTE